MGDVQHLALGVFHFFQVGAAERCARVAASAAAVDDSDLLDLGRAEVSARQSAAGLPVLHRHPRNIESRILQNAQPI